MTESKALCTSAHWNAICLAVAEFSVIIIQRRSPKLGRPAPFATSYSYPEREVGVESIEICEHNLAGITVSHAPLSTVISISLHSGASTTLIPFSRVFLVRTFKSASPGAFANKPKLQSLGGTIGSTSAKVTVLGNRLPYWSISSMMRLKSASDRSTFFNALLGASGLSFMRRAIRLIRSSTSATYSRQSNMSFNLGSRYSRRSYGSG